ncbi:DUF4350 domain-containing protein [Pseudomonas typographi]|uniref:DUF4350 domain-containing protein n=1 Tax=Pseudomonas typographi TaxID=2715964 RepID=UPI001685FAF5|nr:DUF4350 domain-containing protein [Pseudomonas typographi]MBD1585754.1 DUF4350 domain-containing protein [Pseudomonas typographi]
MTARRTALLALALVVLGLGSYYLWSHLERVEETADSGPSPDALANPYLAAARFLRGQGLTVAYSGRSRFWAGLSPGASSVVLLADQRALSPAQVQQLLTWVQRGGRLAVVAHGLWNSQSASGGDLLLDTLRIRKSLSADLPNAPRAPATAQQPDLTYLYLENQTAPVRLGFDPAYHLEDPTDKAVAWANSRIATHLMQLAWGDGVITVLSDGALWRNERIGHYDNAWLLWYLNQDRNVTLVLSTTHEPWYSLLWRYFAQAGVAALALALAWCWHRAVRRGPILPAPDPARRSLAEHLRASATFALRHGGQQRLLQVLRQDLTQHAERHHPGFARLPIAEQWQLLGRLAGQPTAHIAQAMAPGRGNALSRRDFSERVAQLQRIRNAL